MSHNKRCYAILIATLFAVDAADEWINLIGNYSMYQWS